MTTMSPATISAKLALTIRSRLWRDFLISTLPMSEADLFWYYNQIVMTSDTRCVDVDRKIYDLVKSRCGVVFWRDEEISDYADRIRDEIEDEISEAEQARSAKTFRPMFGVYMTDDEYEREMELEGVA